MHRGGAVQTRRCPTRSTFGRFALAAMRGGMKAWHARPFVRPAASRHLSAAAPGVRNIERHGGLFAAGPPPFDQVAIGQAELGLQSRQQPQQFLLSFLRVRLTRQCGIDGALKGGNSQRIESRAADEVTTGYLSCARTELVGGYVASEIPSE